MRVEIALPCRPGSAGAARDAVGRLRGHLSDSQLADLRLLVSEVVTNALRHTGMGPDDTIGLTIHVRGERVRIEVTDAGPGFTPSPRSAGPSEPGGWGLHLVERLTARWGVEKGDRTTVWFEVARA